MRTTHQFTVKVETESAKPLSRDQEEAVLRLLLRGGLQSGEAIDGVRLARYRIRIPGTSRVSECSFNG